MTAARIKRAANLTLQRTMGSRCSPLTAERGVIRTDRQTMAVERTKAEVAETISTFVRGTGSP
jgi:hypothetical protein